MAGPIELALKTDRQIALARLQDRVVDAVFGIEPDVVLHGGTAIWRCYGGNRFSEDIDVYATDRQVKKLAGELTWALSRLGILLDHPLISARALEFSDRFAKSRLEAMRPKARLNAVQREYSRCDGTKTVVTTLSASALALEKIDAYVSRAYVRDLYDMYHLAINERLDDVAKRALRAFAKTAARPADEKRLRELIYVGAAPTFDTMVSALRDL